MREKLTNPKSQVYTFEGLNHQFQTVDKIEESYAYWDNEITIEEKVIDKINTWIQSLDKTLK